MKKSELKVGEEYAVFLSPGTTRRFLNGRWYNTREAPFRVTLLAIDAVDRAWVRGSYSHAWTPGNVKGHRVTLPTNRTDRTVATDLQITIYENYVESAVADPAIIDIGPKEESGHAKGTRKATYRRDSLVLENAGCFVSTWAEYERRAKEQAEAIDAEKARALARRIANDAAAPAIEAKLQSVLAKLEEYGEVMQSGYGRDTEQPRYIEVDGVGVHIDGELRYVDGEAGADRVLAGAKFTIGLDTLAYLLGVAEQS